MPSGKVGHGSQCKRLQAHHHVIGSFTCPTPRLHNVILEEVPSRTHAILHFTSHESQQAMQAYCKM